MIYTTAAGWSFRLFTYVRSVKDRGSTLSSEQSTFHKPMVALFSSKFPPGLAISGLFILIILLLPPQFMPQCVKECSRTFGSEGALSWHRKSCSVLALVRQKIFWNSERQRNQRVGVDYFAFTKGTVTSECCSSSAIYLLLTSHCCCYRHILHTLSPSQLIFCCCYGGGHSGIRGYRCMQ